MPRLSVAAAAVIAILAAHPASATELWDCNYIDQSAGTGGSNSRPLKVYARFEIDGAEMHLVNGAARYHIIENTDFGLMATWGDLCDFCTGGPLIATKVVALNKQNGNLSVTTVFMTSKKSNSVTDNGTCEKIS